MSVGIIEAGAMARTTQDVEIEGRRYRKGQQLIIEDYVSAEESDDGIPFYWGSTDGNYNNVWIHADRVELAKSLADMRRRTIPTAGTIMDALSFEVMGSFDEFSIDETDRESPSEISVYGRTNDGLHFGFRLSIAGLHEVDG